jgi:glycosyltransferase involved in cell wall biosynthesis
MKNLYFDITDIVQYARGHNQVSGIQRVQLRVISALAKKHVGEGIYCVYWNAADKQLYKVPAVDVFPEDDYNPRRLLIRLGAEKGGVILDTAEMKKTLQKFNNRKIYRGFKKAELYVTAILNPSRLKKLGYHIEVNRTDVKLASVKSLMEIDARDCLIFLGANWSIPDVLSFGAEHHDKGGDVVQMLYDLIPYKEPKYFTAGLIEAFNTFLKSTPAYATRFSCISDWTKKDLQEFLNSIGYKKFHAETVALAHEFSGFSRNQKNIAPRNLDLLGIQKPYVLCVGTVEVRKNGANLLRAWKLLSHELGEKTPRLIFAGKYGWKISEFTKILDEDGDLAKLVTVIQSPSDRDLAYLYENCQFTVYPSFYEGWGLPVGEAAWFGKYCVASQATSIPEVCGDVIDYVDPNNIEDIKEKIKRAATDPVYLLNKEASIKSLPLRTWQDVADKLYSYLHQ